MNEKKRLEFQQKLIQRQSEQIESLKAQIEKKKLELEEKDNIIRSVDSLRSELSKKVVEIDGFKEEYRELMDELKKMKNIIDEKVYKGKWWLFRLLIR